MTPAPPPRSQIAVVAEDGAEALLIPQRQEGVARVFPPLFLMIWLIFWAFALSAILQKALAGEANAFELVWLAFWIVGGAFALRILHLQLRPRRPARLVFKPEGLFYDSGYAPPKFDRRNNGFAMLRAQSRCEIFSSAELRSLALRETESGNRLTIDRGVERIDLAPSASEVERQWLYGLLRARYRL